MDLLAAPVSALSNIGPKYKKLLEKLDIYTVEDLLYHIPFRYDDYSEVKRIADITEGEIITVRATMGSVENIFTRYGKKLTRGIAADFSGKINLIWFNQHYIKKVIQVGKTYSISGKITSFDKKLTIISPELEEVKEGSLNTGRLVPIYFETLGVTSKWMRTRINDVLSKLNTKNEPKDLLPQTIKRANDLKDLAWSLNKIHFPENLIEAKEAKTRLAFEELFYDLLKVEVRKDEWKARQQSFTYKPCAKELTKFEDDLPFELTDSQIQSSNEITTDLISPHPMNRLLEGDVGTGKTVVALIAAYLTHLNGFKTIYLAPTEILAQQHFETFSKLLAETNAKVSLLTRSNKKLVHESDIIIGTHAVLFKQELFKNVGLVIIDEQHRFGVEQRGKLIEMSKTGEYSPNILTMTATPIPRTLALTVYGDLTLSTLKTHPKSKREIVTKVISEQQRMQIYEWVKTKSVSTFVVCPFIETSEDESLSNVKAAEDEYKNLQSGVLKGVPMGLIHGRMTGIEKQKIISQFRNGEIKVLVATPVIEVGIDIPDATVIIIEGGERYGLASLHQLRGRVGRETGKGFCFVFMSAYSAKAYARLKNLEEITDGMKLAEIDMKMRGQGDIFSTMQHGFKRFRIASLDDFSLIEKVKQAAETVFGSFEKYPEIKGRVEQQSSGLVERN